MNYKMIRYLIGKMLRIEALLLLIPTLVSVYYREPIAKTIFQICVGLTVLGSILSYEEPDKSEFYAKEGLVIVATTWLVLSLCGALPFYLTGEIPSYIDSFFETVSGFTTTGSTILTDIEVMSKGLLFWRSFTHWIGGMGVLVFAFAIFSQSSVNSMYIMKAEVPGHKVGKLVSKISLTARILYGIYILLTVIEVGFLYVGGMSFFDCWIHAFSTAGTGGFSSHNASIAYFDSVYIETVITVFMILFGINFQLYYFLLLKKFKDCFGSEELRYYLLIILGAIILISFNIRAVAGSWGEAVRGSSFQVAAIITTTGFVTRDYQQWPFLSQGILLTLMYIGAMSGSTGGGIKVSRIILMIKNTVMGIRKIQHPNRVFSIQIENSPVPTGVMQELQAYFNLYLCIMVISLLVLLSQGMDLLSTFGAVSCCLNNVGPGLGVVGPVDNFSSLTNISKLILSFDMLAGRLELFPMVIIFLPTTWRKN